MPAAYQAVMDYEIQKANLTGNVKCFIDDLLVHSDTFEEHLQHVERVLCMLESCRLKAHPEKTLVCTDTVEFLGFDVSQHGLTPSEAKVKALLDMRYPANVEELRTALGKLRYYSCFCANFSQRARALLDLLKKGVAWVFGKTEESAFNDLRQEIATPGKALQRFDPKRPTFIHTDFSNIGLGAVLSQVDDQGRGTWCAALAAPSTSMRRTTRHTKASVWLLCGRANCSSITSTA